MTGPAGAAGTGAPTAAGATPDELPDALYPPESAREPAVGSGCAATPASPAGVVVDMVAEGPGEGDNDPTGSRLLALGGNDGTDPGADSLMTPEAVRGGSASVAALSPGCRHMEPEVLKTSVAPEFFSGET